MSETDVKLFEKLTSNYGKDVFLSYLNIFNELMDEIFDKKVVRNLNFYKITYLKNFGESFCVKLFGDCKIEWGLFKNIRKFIWNIINIICQ